MGSFKEKVYRVVKKIPLGKTMSYKEVAKKAGKPKGWRLVGNILNKNYNPFIPCHRVIRSDGSLTGYNQGKDKKREILQQEQAELFGQN